MAPGWRESTSLVAKSLHCFIHSVPPLFVRARRWRYARTVVGVVIAGLTTLGACAREPEPPRALWIGGDVHLGARRHDVLGPLARELAPAAGFVNLEGPIVSVPRPDLPVANGARAPARLRAVGVRAVGIANNHAADAGAGGPAATAAALRAARLLPVAGARAAILEVDGVRVAITAHDLGRGVPPALDADLEAARRSADRLVATFHVTGPETYLPPPELREAVERAVVGGADVVAAHGSHQVGAIERRGAQVIAWGLGNVAFDCACTDEKEAIVLRLTPSGRGFDVEVIPIEAGLGGRAARRSPDPDGVLDLLEALGSPRFERLGALGRVPE